jgi:23S rRNA (cytidine1920-2'-O)/16S rRNA (cytidine1409-2'-O)-methyltransferase
MRAEGGQTFVSRAGQKLDHALSNFSIDVRDKTCADLGSNVGGFVDCLLQRGAAKVYAIDTGYGVLEWKLRKDPRVVTMERTNAMHVALPELVDLVTIDVAWTKQRMILPAAAQLLAPRGQVVTLVKPHYEAARHYVRGGVLKSDHLDEVLQSVKQDIRSCGFDLAGWIASPIKGAKGNAEFLAHLVPQHPSG